MSGVNKHALNRPNADSRASEPRRRHPGWGPALTLAVSIPPWAVDSEPIAAPGLRSGIAGLTLPGSGCGRSARSIVPSWRRPVPLLRSLSYAVGSTSAATGSRLPPSARVNWAACSVAGRA